MIKIEHIYTGNWEAAIRSMRNPLNSWPKSDSWFDGVDGSHEGFHKIDGTVSYEVPDHNDDVQLGENDLKLSKTLATAGSDHGKFLRCIIFSCDITAPMYWWKEMDTYKVGTVRNSCSTMHKIMAKEFEFDDFSHEHLDSSSDSMLVLTDTIDALNNMREHYISEADPDKEKDYWWQVIQLLPSSYNQRATWTANYEVLRNIYHARKKHKLDEWREFCKMIEELPYSELITEPRVIPAEKRDNVYIFVAKSPWHSYHSIVQAPSMGAALDKWRDEKKLDKDECLTTKFGEDRAEMYFVKDGDAAHNVYYLEVYVLKLKFDGETITLNGGNE